MFAIEHKRTLTPEESRALAIKVTNEQCKLNDPSHGVDTWFNSYMHMFNKIMDSIDAYNKEVETKFKD